MAEDVVLARFRADLDQVRAEFEAYIDELEKVQHKEKDAQNETKKTATTAQSAAKIRSQAIKAEQAELKRLEAARKAAFTPKAIDDFNKKIEESKRKISTLRLETESTGSVLKGFAGEIAAGIAAAFSIQQIIQFGKTAVNAFLEAEENAKRLEFAVKQIAGEGEAAFQRLLDQSTKLQEISIFSDDAVQQSQTMLATFGLTSQRIEEIIPRIADFASATKTDLTSATETFIRALEGQTRGLVAAGLKFEDTGTIIGNYNKLLESTTKLTGATEEATKTLSGGLAQLENQADELMEQIGEGLAPSFVKAKVVFLDFVKTIAENIGLIRAADPFQTQAGNRRDEIIAEFKGSIDALVNVGITLDEARQKVNDRLTERLRSEIGRKIGVAEFATEVALLKEELATLEKYNEQLKLQAAEEARQLTAQGLKKLTIEDLNKLLKENQALQDAVSKDNVTLINKEIDERKKAADKLDKQLKADAEKRRQEYERQFEEFRKRLEQEQDELGKAIDAAEKKMKDKEALLEFQVRFVANLEGEDEALKLARDTLFKIYEEEKLQAEVTSDTVEEVNAKKQKAYEKYIEAITKLVGNFSMFEQEETDKSLKAWFNKNQEIIDNTMQLADELNRLFSQISSNQIAKIEKQTDAELDALEKRGDANEDLLERRAISEKEFAKAQEELEREKVRTQEAADRKIRDIKRREFIANKVAALAQIIISTAKNIAEKPALTGFYLGIGAAQGAIVAAQPIPYRKGTKDSGPNEHLARVGEEGEELVMMKPNSKVVPAQQTRKYEKFVDAMIDNRLDGYVFKEFTAPALDKQARKFEQEKERTFTENISKSIVNNTEVINNTIAPGRADFYLERLVKSGVRITNLEELREALRMDSRISSKR